VRWSTLAASYSDVYSESLDLAQLGHETSSAAAHALLAEVLRHQRQDVAGRAAEDLDDPLVAVDDVVALTPLPGFVGSWPALYQILCDLVRTCGSEEEAQCDGDLQGRILLLSQLRPLLDNASDEEQTPASQARSLLLSQLQPVSKLTKEGASSNGLSFRDSEGCLRKLQKLGHVVKAVLQWRDRRVQWRQTREAKPTVLDHAVGPKLELVFCKRLNNLVLCLNDQVDDITGRWEDGLDDVSQRVDSSLDRRPFEDNPFKWQPIAPSSESKLAALKRSSSTPALRLKTCGDTSSVVEEVSGISSPEQCAAKVSNLEEQPPMPDENTAGGGRRPSLKPSIVFPRRSPSRGARSPSCPSRSRSLGRSDACLYGVTMRCTSEPPRQRWADMCDDADDCAQFHWFQTLPSDTSCEKSQLVAPAADVTVESTAICECVAKAVTAKDKVNSAQRWISPRPVSHATTLVDQRSPSIGARGSSRVGRARSLTPRDDSYVHWHSVAASHEYIRCTSEPPQNRWLDIFDDPFEPPPQEVKWDVTGAPTDHALCEGDGISCSPIPESSEHPVSPLPVTIFQRDVREHHSDVMNYESQLMTPPAKRRTKSTERIGRARSLTRSLDGAMRREGRAAWDDDGEQRCTSEPPNCRYIGSFDDPFEPPPQNVWCSSSVSVEIGHQFDFIENENNRRRSTEAAASHPKLPQYGGVFFAPQLLFSCEQPVPVTSHRRRFHSRSLTRTSSNEPSRLPILSRQDVESGNTRCTSAPPHQRDISIFDDPFEPPPQQLVWSWPVSPVHATSVPLRC